MSNNIDNANTIFSIPIANREALSVSAGGEECPKA